jgi:hypothetical protein
MKALIIILILTLPVLTYSQESSPFEYISISQAGNVLSITTGTEKYEVIDIKKAKDKDQLDIRPLLKRVENYESNGWEVYSFNQYNGLGTGTLIATHFLLRRKKK